MAPDDLNTALFSRVGVIRGAVLGLSLVFDRFVFIFVFEFEFEFRGGG